MIVICRLNKCVFKIIKNLQNNYPRLQDIRHTHTHTHTYICVFYEYKLVKNIHETVVATKETNESLNFLFPTSYISIFKLLK